MRNGSAGRLVGEHSMPPRELGRKMRSRSGGSPLVTCGKMLLQRARCFERQRRGDPARGGSGAIFLDLELESSISTVFRTLKSLALVPGARLGKDSVLAAAVVVFP